MHFMNWVIGSSGHLVIDFRDLEIGMFCDRCPAMSAQSDQLKERTICFAVAILRLIDRYPRTVAANVIAQQLAKSATSIGANYRAACSGRSRAEFIAKLHTVVEEAEESVYWLDIVVRSGLLSLDVRPLRKEANELLAIFASSLRTARANLRSHQVITGRSHVRPSVPPESP
jgi:four helix bundle protein